MVSDIALPDLAAAVDTDAHHHSGTRPIITFDVHGHRAIPHATHDGEHTWPALVNNAPYGHVLQFSGAAEFSIDQDGRQVTAWIDPGTDSQTLRHLLLDHVLPRVLALRGRLVLHGATVMVEREAISFLGDTGCGKSTLAASFGTAGFRVTSDDGMVLDVRPDGVVAWPLYPSLRLWPEAVAHLFAQTPGSEPMASYSSKRRVSPMNADGMPASALPLRALFVLNTEGAADSPTIEIAPLSQRDACVAIMRNAFRLDPADHAHIQHILHAAGEMARRVQTFSVRYPHHFVQLPEVRAAILACCAAGKDIRHV